MTSRASNLRINIVMQTMAFIAVSVMSFIVTPYILKHIEYAVYGLFALTSSVMLYLNYMEGGLSAGLFKYLSGFVAREEWDTAESYLNTTVLLYSFISAIALVIGITLAFTYHLIFNIDVQFIVIGRWLFILETFLLAFTLFIAPFIVTMNSFQKRSIQSGISFVSELIRLPLLIFVFNYFSWSTAFILYVGLFNISLIIFWSVSICFFLRKYFPQYRFRLNSFNRKIAKTLFSISVWVFVSQICMLIVDRTDNIVLATFLNVDSITFYTLGANVVQKARSFARILLAPIFVVVANVIGLNDHKRSKKILFQGSRLFTLSVGAFFVVLFVFFERFILLWVGPDFVSSIAVGRLLGVYFFLTILTQVPAQFLFLKGVIKVPTIINVIGALLNLVLSIIFVRRFGLIGVAWGTVLPQAFFVLPATLWVLKYAEIGLGRFIMRVIMRVIPFLSFAVLFSWAALIFSNNYLSILTNVWYLIIYLGFVYGALMSCYYLFFCRGEDRDMLWKVVAGNSGLREKLPKFLR